MQEIGETERDWRDRERFERQREIRETERDSRDRERLEELY